MQIATNFLNMWREWTLYNKSKRDYLKTVRNTLNECVYGQEETKS